MFTCDDYFTGPNGVRRDVVYSSELTHEILANAQVTVDRWNLLLSYFYSENPGAKRRRFASGWRSKAINAATPGAAPFSHHMDAEAGDVEDEDRDLAKWILANEDESRRVENPSHAAMIGLWFEDFRTTPTWVHGQIVPPHSLNRIYIPSNNWAARLGGRVLTIASLEAPLTLENLT